MTGCFLVEETAPVGEQLVLQLMRLATLLGLNPKSSVLGFVRCVDGNQMGRKKIGSMLGNAPRPRSD